MWSCWLTQPVKCVSDLNFPFRAAPEGGGNKVLGSRRGVRPPLRLPGRTVRAEGWWWALRLRLFPDHGQRRRFLQLLRRLPPGPLRGMDGGKKEQTGRLINGWAREFWRSTDWKRGSFRRCGGTLAWILDPQCLPGQIHWRMERLRVWRLRLWKNAARGHCEREKREWICLPHSPLSETYPTRARYTKIKVQSRQNKWGYLFSVDS